MHLQFAVDDKTEAGQERLRGVIQTILQFADGDKSDLGQERLRGVIQTILQFADDLAMRLTERFRIAKSVAVRAKL